DGITPVEADIDFGRMRYSTGVSFNWFSPIGPFSMSYSEPLNEESGDRVENFQINLGTVFR
ncbi:MAG: BamA/TamA family outer membrane protein, partial [Gammaproteobacteria bacterium]